MYKGTITNQDCFVDKPNGEPLSPRLDLRNHSPDGFAWGYMGSGPSQLALALLADVIKDDAIAIRFYLDFKEEVIAGLNIDKPWELSKEFIEKWLWQKYVDGEVKH